jgi:hypothetical protein
VERKLKNKVLNKNIKHEDVYSIDNIKQGNVALLQNNTFYSDKGERMTASPSWDGMNMSASSFNGDLKQTNIDRANDRLNRQMRDLFERQQNAMEQSRKQQRKDRIAKLFRKLTGRVIYSRIKAFTVTNRPKITYSNVKKYIKAELSKIEQGPVSLPIYEERKKICGECPHRKYVDGYKDPLGFCTKCGCGANPRAQLTVKLKLPATSCPLDKWGESTGIYEGFWGRIRYILSRNKKGQDNG